MTDKKPMLLIAEKGRLSPATPMDQEDILKFADGEQIECSLRPIRNAKDIRKLYAVVGLAVKQCPTPWMGNADDAIAALKERLGLVRSVPGVGPERVRVLSSLHEISAVDMQDFMEGCWLVLRKLTGIDPLTLGKETGDTANAAADVAADSPSEDSPTSFQTAVVAPPPEDPGEQPEPEPPAPEPPAPVAPADDPAALRREMIDKLFHLANEPLTVEQRLAVLEQARPWWTDKIGEAAARPILDTIAKVIRGELPADAARRFLTA